MKIDHKVAIRILREEADASLSGQVNSAWLRKIERLSHLCEQGVSKTHIAFLGTTILAKASDGRADLFAIKPEHAKDNENAYSARSLAHGVLVPAAAELGFSIGVTGRDRSTINLISEWCDWTTAHLCTLELKLRLTTCLNWSGSFKRFRARLKPARLCEHT